MIYADLHRHILPGLDDGASSETEMRRMLDEAYADGVRLLCATPHFHPGIFPYTEEARAQAFAGLRAYAEEAYPDMRLYEGAELRYGASAREWLLGGACPTLAGTRYVLVDFLPNEGEEAIFLAMRTLLNAGFLPVIAHAERYLLLSLGRLLELRKMGVLIQLDAGSLFGEWGPAVKRRAKAMVRRYLADIVGSDAHHENSPVCSLDQARALVERMSGAAYAEALFYQNPLAVLSENPQGKEL